VDLGPERLRQLGVEQPGVLALRQWKNDGRVDELIHVAVDRSFEYDSRFWAIRFLASLHDDRVVDALVDVLGDPDETLRSQAARSLRLIADARAVPALSRAAFDGDGSVRIEAVRALGEIGDPAAVPTLLKVVQTTSWDLLHESGIGQPCQAARTRSRRLAPWLPRCRTSRR
jgi:HEAT repeat protein